MAKHLYALYVSLFVQLCLVFYKILTLDGQLTLFVYNLSKYMYKLTAFIDYHFSVQIVVTDSCRHNRS